MRVIEYLRIIIFISLSLLFKSASADFQTSTQQSLTMYAAVAVFVVIFAVMVILILVMRQTESYNIKAVATLSVAAVIVIVLMFSMFNVATQLVSNSVIPVPPLPPLQPFLTNAIARSGTSIQIYWSDLDPTITGYRIDRESPIDGGFSTIVSNTHNTLLNYNDTGLSVGTQYNYFVYGINSGGSTSGSNTFSATTWNVPLSPFGLHATALSTTSIGLSWGTPLDNGGTPITGYKIERQSLCSGVYGNLNGNTGNATTSYNDTGLSISTCYSYRVSAINVIGTSLPSNTYNATTPAVPKHPPNAPTNLKSFTLSTTAIKLNWTAPTNGPVNGYLVQGGISGFPTISANTTNSTTQYTAIGLIPNSLYQFKIFAMNASGTGPASNIAQNYTTILSVTGPPTGLTATARNSTMIQLSWAAPIISLGNYPVTGYKVERQLACTGGYSVLVANTTNTFTNYNNTGLTASKCYSYRVDAINHKGTSSPSNTSNATTSALILPNPPTNLKSYTLSTTAIKLNWTAPTSAISGYRVEQQNGSSGGFGVVTANTTNSTIRYTVTNLISNTLYQFRVETLNKNGTSIPSNIIQNTTFAPPITVPNPPTNLNAIALNNSAINISWSAPVNNGGSSINGYKIERQSACTGGYSVLVANTTNTFTNYNNTGIASNTCFSYRVSALNIIGSSSPSNTANATTNAKHPPNAPTNLKSFTLSTTAIKLNWTAPTNGPTNSYYIQDQLGTNGGFGTVANTTNSTTAYTVTALNQHVLYQFRVFGVNASGTGPASNIAQNYTTIPGVPTPPTGLTATARNSTMIQLSWVAPPNYPGNQPVTGYKLQREPTCAGGFFLLVNNTGNILTNYNSTGLTANKCYSYKVFAWNSFGLSTGSNIASATTPGLVLPNPPTNLIATTLTNTTIKLTWTAPTSAISGYKVEDGLAPSGGFGVVTANTTNSTTHYTVTNLLSSKSYNFRVSTLNKNGTSLPSNIATNTTFAPPTSIFWQGEVLQYNSGLVHNLTSVIYPPILDNIDFSQIREANGGFNSTYIGYVKMLIGSHCAELISLADIQSQAASLKSQGLTCLEYDIEPNLSPPSDLVNATDSIIKAAAAAHAQGLRFGAVPAKTITFAVGLKVAPYVDEFTLQSQPYQNTCTTGNDKFKAFVISNSTAMHNANHAIQIEAEESASVSTGTIPGYTQLTSMEACFAEVDKFVNGTTSWFGANTTQQQILNGFVQWFHTNYD